ncbi:MULTISPECIES: hypothetical protein [unclassified Imperialibacter]|uniref:hypothetical protein n=1 Tax=unclassified Imperialibacter TaxID=2629706 RepID=UPI001255C045|nr:MULTISPECIES: hypothetical protein [unclassified Imperialibacter]CAD5277537.1 conserved hypothetical protein [Imperialibacter sp. 75]CAD5295441.1 conserved hypothetical protein [Imperialibacter sp. 89]VVT12055.1 hypothetical protein IMPR6_20087 [Imperialibacter sp. EC-SDR9]
MDTNTKLPNFELDKSQRLWLNELYKLYKGSLTPDYKVLRVNLLKKVPLDFNPQNINRHLVDYKGERLTLLGINVVDPEAKILDKANNVIRYIREAVISDPTHTEFQISEIISSTKLEPFEIQVILDSINRFGSFWTGSSGSINTGGYRSVSFNHDDDNRIFDQYISFDGIEKLIHNYFQNEKREETAGNGHFPKPTQNLKTFDRIFRGDSSFGNQPNNESQKTSINFSPIFQSKIEHIDLSLCFVLMPFTQGWSNRVYRKLIKPMVESFGLQCLRADNLTGPIVIEDIWAKINQSAFIIADVTGRNPNVMYELGLVHTIGKPAILITQEIDKIPFDFTHLRHHPYADDIEGFEAFGEKLEELIYALYRENFPEFKLTKSPPLAQ